MVKRSPTLGTLVSTKTKCIKLIFIGKITLIPVAFFNGFKYICTGHNIETLTYLLTNIVINTHLKHDRGLNGQF